jgi:hypothetical protein
MALLPGGAPVWLRTWHPGRCHRLNRAGSVLSALLLDGLTAGFDGLAAGPTDRLNQRYQALGPVVGVQHPCAEGEGGKQSEAADDDGDCAGAYDGGYHQADGDTQPTYCGRDAGAHGSITPGLGHANHGRVARGEPQPAEEL